MSGSRAAAAVRSYLNQLADDPDGAIASWLAEDVVYRVAADADGSGPAIPWRGSFSGRDGARHLFRLLHEHVEPLAFSIETIIGEGEIAAVFGSYGARSRRTGAEFSTPFAQRFHVEDGVITQVAVFEDTLAIARALGGAGETERTAA